MRRWIAAAALLLCVGATPVDDFYTRGETLDYDLTWLRMTGGSARMTIAPAGENRLRMTSVGKSGAFISRFFHVRDEIESVVQRDNFSTLTYRKRLDEKGKKKDELTTIEDGVATRVRKQTRKTRVPTPVLDPLSVMYYLRTVDLSPGTRHELQLIADGKLYEVHAIVIRRETITTTAGRFNTVLVSPQMESSGVERDERLYIWFTDDERRIPVRIRTDVNFGTITASLRAVTPGVTSIDPPLPKGQ